MRIPDLSRAGNPRLRLHAAASNVAGRAAVLARRHNWLVEEPAAAIADPVAAPPVLGFNEALHALRSNELSRMPRVTGTILSAGCSGTLYFDWIHANYGTVSRHIGVELYLPEPEGLPAEVEWLKRSVGDFADVEDQSVELIFSGQNIEHLFGDDVAGFLIESHRVLAPGGWLVIDSPNREVASAVNWSQPEHTIEFTPAEASELVTLAGFDVVDIRGLWLCRDPRTDEVLPLWGADGDEAASVPLAEMLRRSELGIHDPANSFVWWLEATRAERDPDVDALNARYREIYAVAWPERQRRFRHLVGARGEADGEQVVSVPAAVPGFAMFGPYMPLAPGRYDVTFTLRRGGSVDDDAPIAVVDAADVDAVVLAERTLRGAELPENVWTDVEVTFVVDELTWGGQFRVVSTGAAALDVRFGAAVEFVPAGD